MIPWWLLNFQVGFDNSHSKCKTTTPSRVVMSVSSIVTWKPQNHTSSKSRTRWEKRWLANICKLQNKSKSRHSKMRCKHELFHDRSFPLCLQLIHLKREGGQMHIWWWDLTSLSMKLQNGPGLSSFTVFEQHGFLLGGGIYQENEPLNNPKHQLTRTIIWTKPLISGFHV